MRARVVPVLLIDDGGLVKSVEFGKYNYIGDPMNAIRHLRYFCFKEK